jgi:EAL domain-containing protein (putative c-di-GMP-specific phosphodiesterase class I)
LVLELTELHPEQMEALQDCVRALRGGGIRVELDDFGSSVGLGHLLDLAVDGIKLEAGLVARCAQDSRALKLAAHMIEAAHDLGVRVTAENVENALAKPLLRGLACDRAQGFAFGRPRRVVRVEDILDS